MAPFPPNEPNYAFNNYRKKKSYLKGGICLPIEQIHACILLKCFISFISSPCQDFKKLTWHRPHCSYVRYFTCHPADSHPECKNKPKTTRLPTTSCINVKITTASRLRKLLEDTGCIQKHIIKVNGRAGARIIFSVQHSSFVLTLCFFVYTIKNQKI